MSTTSDKQPESNMAAEETCTKEQQPKPKPAIHGQLLNGRSLLAKNEQSKLPKVVSTPANIKRLQVNKWFNSPTDNLFSPCSKKLYNTKKAHQPVHLIDELNEMDNENQMMQNNSPDENKQIQ